LSGLSREDGAILHALTQQPGALGRAWDVHQEYLKGEAARLGIAARWSGKFFAQRFARAAREPL
jgi:hypothetical protein